MVELEPNNGEVWSAMGHCFLMQDELQKAYMAYQQALYFLENPKVRGFFEKSVMAHPWRPKLSLGVKLLQGFIFGSRRDLSGHCVFG